MTYWSLLLAMPLLAFAGPSTSEKDCTPVDLRNEILGSVRNQKDVAWCYAFSAADMLNYSFDETEKISAADVAIGYNQTSLGRFARWMSVNVINRTDGITIASAHQTGFNKLALMRAQENGWCPESVFPSEAWIKKTKTEDGWKEESIPLAQAMLDIAVLHQDRHRLTVEKLPYYYAFKNVGPAEFITLLKEKKLAKFYAGLRNTVCKDDRRPFNDEFKVKMVIKNPRIFNRISEQLEAGRPVGLDYDSRVLKSKDHRGFSFSNLHTSPIVGRRWNAEAKSCEFLIRNSYGSSCSERYDPSYACEEGNIWLDESLIFSSMTSIVYMLSGK